MTTKRKARYILQVRPDGVGPLWWPHDRRDTCDGVEVPDPGKFFEVVFLWCTVTGDGGFSQGIQGIDDWGTVLADGISARVSEWFEEHGAEDDGDGEDWPWVFRLLEVDAG